MVCVSAQHMQVLTYSGCEFELLSPHYHLQCSEAERLEALEEEGRNADVWAGMVSTARAGFGTAGS